MIVEDSLNLFRFPDRLFISESSQRKAVLQDLKNGMITCIDNRSWWADRPMFKQLLRSINRTNLPIYRDLLKSLASSSPITSMLLPTKRVESLILSIFKCDDPRAHPILWKSMHEEAPLFYQAMCDGGDTRSLQNLLMEVWNACIESIKSSIPHPLCDVKDKESEMGFFPSLPVKRSRGKFVMDRKPIKKEDGECKKKAAGHPSLLPGIFTIFCEHGMFYIHKRQK